MYHGIGRLGESARDEVRLQLLQRIARTIGVSVGTLLEGGPGDNPHKPRSRLEQADAMLSSFDRIDDPQARERLIALIEVEATIVPEVAV